MREAIVIQTRVLFKDEVLALDKVVMAVDLEQIKISRALAIENPLMTQQRAERRARFTGLLAAQIAHTITEGLFEVK